jgi:hypothetical protein
MNSTTDPIRELRLIYALIVNDKYAATFQSVAQYRRALLKSIITMRKSHAREEIYDQS